MTDIYGVISVVVTFLIGLIVGGVASRTYYKKFKDAVHAVRNCIDDVDDAFADDQISKEEVRQIYEKCFKPIKRLLKK